MLGAPGALVSPTPMTGISPSFCIRPMLHPVAQKHKREMLISPVEHWRPLPCCHLSVGFTTSSVSRKEAVNCLLKWIMPTWQVLKEGGDRETGECGRLFHFPEQCFQHSRGSKGAAVPPPFSCVTGVAEVGCLKAKIALGPACMQISVKMRAVFSGLAPGFSPLSHVLPSPF